ncbi:hypothetical protein ACLOJK_024123 [Asimina triloba]
MRACYHSCLDLSRWDCPQKSQLNDASVGSTIGDRCCPRLAIVDNEGLPLSSFVPMLHVGHVACSRRALAAAHSSLAGVAAACDDDSASPLDLVNWVGCLQPCPLKLLSPWRMGLPPGRRSALAVACRRLVESHRLKLLLEEAERQPWLPL